MKDNSVTIGIPFYSKSNVVHLRSAVESVLNQTQPPEVVHLIQDGYVPKGLARVVRDYQSNCSNCQHIELEKVGLSAALNFSIQQANTTYYGRMDADDICFPERFEKQIKFLDKNPEIDILGTWSIEFEKEANIKKGFLKKLPTEYQEMRKLFHYRNPLIHSTVVFRRTVFEKIGYYNETFLSDQDLELWSRVFRNNIKITNLSEPLLYFRTKNVIKRRSSLPAILRQVKARYSYNTWSIKLNILKMFMLLSRLSPHPIQKLLYKYFRN